MSTAFSRIGTAALLALASPAAIGQELTERDYLADVPAVLSVSRLVQPLNETPGAVTVIDAETIRRSGAREVAELLRLVPGFHVRRRNGGSMVAGYHAALDIYGARMQVYVDGRSVYSSFYLGDTQRGLASVELADVERIEVLRGSNSAALGANAFLGVVNIVTKAAADSRGISLAVVRGEKSIEDNYARFGWGNTGGDFRLSASRRASSGFPTLHDDSRRSQLSFRGDLHPAPGDELRINAGIASESYGEGFPPKTSCETLLRVPGTCDDNKQRSDGWRNGHLRIEWSRDLGLGSMLRLAASIDDEEYRSDFVAEQFTATLPVVTLRAPLDFGGRGRRQNLEFQRSDEHVGGLRTVFGAEMLREEVWSPFLFSTQGGVSANALRAFGGLEWKPVTEWVVNVGGLWERHSLAGREFAPRLALNYKLDEASTLRVVTTKAFRMPSIYMLRGRGDYVVSYSPALPPPIPPSPISAPYVATSGTVKAETVIANEIGYLGNFRGLGLKADIRVFSEHVNRRHRVKGLDFVNLPGPEFHGLEYRLDWRPHADTRVVLSEVHLRERVDGSGNSERGEGPQRGGSLALFQALPSQFDLALIHSYATGYLWGAGQTVGGSHELDLRLARTFRVGGTRGEAALTVQGLGSGYRGFVPDQVSGRRAFFSLRLDH